MVTSDCATIVKELEIQHPAARMLVLACEMQEKECGDGTNFVVTLAGELLKLSEELLRTGLHTSEIVEGYKRAYDKVRCDGAIEVIVAFVDYIRNQKRKPNGKGEIDCFRNLPRFLCPSCE